MKIYSDEYFVLGPKNIDDRNSLKPVHGKYVLSQLVSKVNNFFQISQK